MKKEFIKYLQEEHEDDVEVEQGNENISSLVRKIDDAVTEIALDFLEIGFKAGYERGKKCKN